MVEGKQPNIMLKSDRPLTRCKCRKRSWWLAALYAIMVASNWVLYRSFDSATADIETKIDMSRQNDKRLKRSESQASRTVRGKRFETVMQKEATVNANNSDSNSNDDEGTTIRKAKRTDVLQEWNRRSAFVDQSTEKSPAVRVFPFNVALTHELRYDLLGSFIAPTFYLHAVTQYFGWELVILPFAGSLQEEILRDNFKLGNKIDKSWGSGFQDVNRRQDYDPVHLNTVAHDTMNFFPSVSNASANDLDWVYLGRIPLPQELPRVCPDATRTGRCYIRLPDNPHWIQKYMAKVGTYDQFFSEEFRAHLRTEFLRDKPPPRHFDQGTYNIAIHVRRGDILDPYRWIKQEVFASIARRICQQHPSAAVHVFSSGPNRDGNWSALETLVNDCGGVSFHVDEYEFETWLHMVSADAFIMSKSSFSAIPAILCRGEVYFPRGYFHVQLSHWRVFDTETGDLLK